MVGSGVGLGVGGQAVEVVVNIRQEMGRATHRPFVYFRPHPLPGTALALPSTPAPGLPALSVSPTLSDELDWPGAVTIF